MSRRTPALFAAVLTLAVITAGCGSSGSDDDASKSTTTAAGGEATCDNADLPLKEAGSLQVATGEPAFEPWVVDDEPENGKGFESAVVYAVADQLGIDKADVTWTRTGFDEAVAPGEKDYDLNVQQYSITPERDEVVDFSDGYYTVEQAVIASPDSDLADATSLTDLRDVQLGAAIGTTSLDYIDEYIKPSKEPLVFDDNAAAKAAFDAGQVDGIVFDLPTAYYITAAEITDSTIVGVLPQQGDAEELGLLFEDGSPLVPCVNEALAALKDDGTLADLEEQYLNQGGDIPTLTK
ncbi:MAG: amino acid transporter substrate-binding protein [Ilumatobacteraceae bacterium]|nr:amino acid transporter substrate-binding protein [Ilumatobacteraceae bacterium]